MTTETTTYSWQCINQCTGAFILLGHSYGKVNTTGVSQLHISYLNAKTKNKPVIAFIKEDGQKNSKQLDDLIKIIEDQVKTIHYIKDDQNLTELFNDAFEQLALGLEDPKPTIAVLNKLKNQTFASTHSANPTLDTTNTDIFNNEMLAQNPSIFPDPYDNIPLNCTAHSFFGGTLEEVEFVAQLTWQEILMALPASVAFGADTLNRHLNELITPQAMPIIKLKRPNIHAVSRCQVSKSSALWIQEELFEAGWITKSENSTKQRELWRLTDIARNILENISK